MRRLITQIWYELFFGCFRLSEANEMLSVPVIDNLHDHLDVPSIVDAFACSTVSICVSGSTPNVILSDTKHSRVRDIMDYSAKWREFPDAHLMDPCARFFEWSIPVGSLGYLANDRRHFSKRLLAPALRRRRNTFRRQYMITEPFWPRTVYIHIKRKQLLNKNKPAPNITLPALQSHYSHKNEKPKDQKGNQKSSMFRVLCCFGV